MYTDIYMLLLGNIVLVCVYHSTVWSYRVRFNFILAISAGSNHLVLNENFL